MKCGGLSEGAKEADDEIRSVYELIKDDLLKKLGKENTEPEIICYRTQVVAGTNYFVKIKVENEYIHARIFKPLPHTGAPPELVDVKRKQEKETEIDHF